MHRHHLIANALLWAVAMIASALVGAPSFLSAILLPALATISLLLLREPRRGCLPPSGHDPA